MKRTWSKTGVLLDEELRAIPGFPSEEALRKGPVAILRCAEEIPCNPCVKACPKGAIALEGGINTLPVLDSKKCNGCGLCIPSCPGLAIFVVDLTYGETEGLVKLPYEFLPLPKKGDSVILLNAEGKEVGEGLIHGLLTSRQCDRTAVITLRVPKHLALEVNHFRTLQDKGRSDG
jgi:Fe-S-cluster-containing hydrogenase component 2